MDKPDIRFLLAPVLVSWASPGAVFPRSLDCDSTTSICGVLLAHSTANTAGRMTCTAAIQLVCTAYTI